MNDVTLRDKREMTWRDYTIAAAWAVALVPIIVWLVDLIAPYLPLRPQ